MRKMIATNAATNLGHRVTPSAKSSSFARDAILGPAAPSAAVLGAMSRMGVMQVRMDMMYMG